MSRRIPPSLRLGRLLALGLLTIQIAACDQPIAALRELRGETQSAPKPTEPPPLVATPVRVQTVAATHAQAKFEDIRSGSLEAWKQATVAAESNGRVLGRYVELGERVKAKRRLFAIDGHAAATVDRSSAAQFELRHLELQQRDRELARAEMLARGQDISDSQLEKQRHARDAARAARKLAEVERSRARRGLSDTRVRAPFSGIVAALHLEKGDFARVGAPAATIIDISRLKFDVGLTAAELEGLPKRLETQLHLTGGVGTSVTANLHTVAPMPDPRTGLYTAQFVVKNRGSKLRPGMTGRLSLGTRVVEGVIVPRGALVRAGSGYALYVIESVDGQPRARFRQVELGRQGGDGVEVRAGLEPGEQVVVKGQFALLDGASVHIENPASSELADVPVKAGKGAV